MTVCTAIAFARYFGFILVIPVWNIAGFHVGVSLIFSYILNFRFLTLNDRICQIWNIGLLSFYCQSASSVCHHFLRGNKKISLDIKILNLATFLVIRFRGHQSNCHQCHETISVPKIGDMPLFSSVYKFLKRVYWFLNKSLDFTTTLSPC